MLQAATESPRIGLIWKAGKGVEGAGATSATIRKLNLESVRGCNLRERQKEGLAVGPTRRGNGTEIIAVAAGNSFRLAVFVDSVSPAECQLVEYVVAGSFLDQLTAWLVGEKD